MLGLITAMSISLDATIEYRFPLPSEVVQAPNELDLVTIGECVLFAGEYRRCSTVFMDDFPDRTGYESFVNHIHMPYDGTRESLLGSLGFVARLRRTLIEYANDRQFLIILSIAADE